MTDFRVQGQGERPPVPGPRPRGRASRVEAEGLQVQRRRHRTQVQLRDPGETIQQNSLVNVKLRNTRCKEKTLYFTIKDI